MNEINTWVEEADTSCLVKPFDVLLHSGGTTPQLCQDCNPMQGVGKNGTVFGFIQKHTIKHYLDELVNPGNYKCYRRHLGYNWWPIMNPNALAVRHDCIVKQGWKSPFDAKMVGDKAGYFISSFAGYTMKEIQKENPVHPIIPYIWRAMLVIDFWTLVPSMELIEEGDVAVKMGATKFKARLQLLRKTKEKVIGDVRLTDKWIGKPCMAKLVEGYYVFRRSELVKSFADLKVPSNPRLTGNIIFREPLPLP